MKITPLTRRRALASSVSLMIETKQAHVRLVHALGPRRLVVSPRRSRWDAREHLKRAVHAQTVREDDDALRSGNFPRVPANFQSGVVREVTRARDARARGAEFGFPFLFGVGVHTRRVVS